MNKNFTALVKRKIDKLASGETITADHFTHAPKNTLIKILNRLTNDGVLVRIKRGVYAKGKMTRFGLALPTPIMVLAQEIDHNPNQCFGGLFLFNQLGLTTQVPTVIEILNNKSSYKSKIGSTRIRYIKIRPIIDKSSKKHIQLLEVIKKIHSIPDGYLQTTFSWLVNELNKRDNKKLCKLVNTAMHYPPRVRAILGCLLTNKNKALSEKLRKSLNENSYYRVGQAIEFLTNQDKWNFKGYQHRLMYRSIKL